MLRASRLEVSSTWDTCSSARILLTLFKFLCFSGLGKVKEVVRLLSLWKCCWWYWCWWFGVDLVQLSKCELHSLCDLLFASFIFECWFCLDSVRFWTKEKVSGEDKLWVHCFCQSRLFSFVGCRPSPTATTTKVIVWMCVEVNWCARLQATLLIWWRRIYLVSTLKCEALSAAIITAQTDTHWTIGRVQSGELQSVPLALLLISGEMMRRSCTFNCSTGVREIDEMLVKCYLSYYWTFKSVACDAVCLCVTQSLSAAMVLNEPWRWMDAFLWCTLLRTQI